MCSDYLPRILDFKQRIKLGKKCAECGEDNIQLLEFAHYDRSKKTIAMSGYHPIPVMEAELPYGRFLCIWCHRLETKREVHDIIKSKNYEYSAEESNVPLDDKAKSCSGPMCNGKTRPSSFFYERKGKLKARCKKCVLLETKIKSDKKQALRLKVHQKFLEDNDLIGKKKCPQCNQWKDPKQFSHFRKDFCRQDRVKSLSLASGLKPHGSPLSHIQKKGRFP